MTASENLANQRLSLLMYAKEINNISRACRVFGVSRELFYNYKRRFEVYGYEGLKEKKRSFPKMPNQTQPDKEKNILDFSIQYPTFGPQRVSNEMKRQGVQISPGGVYNIFKRHGLSHRYDRLLALEKQSLEKGIILTQGQIEALKRIKPPEKHIEAFFAGYLFSQDTFYIGHLKGLGKIYAQVGIDGYSSFGFAHVYRKKTAATAMDFLKNHVLGVYDLFRIPLMNVLTDNGKEYTTHWPTKRHTHIYERFLKKEKVHHRYTKVRTPRTNGFVERFNRTLLEEFFKPQFLKKVYTSIEQLQQDLNEYLAYYNTKRTHQGRNLNGKTPIQKFVDWLGPKCLTA